ncbi:SDR family oxidoreductase [Luteimonas abyssi]|uniref:SDR family oxidoreductase n=1 Tax=Luteimonas abyssi TaxID=1247514 RepID=UPI000737BB05|nr:SDR family oxidoreductase [Luteimonas abyssi]
MTTSRHVLITGANRGLGLEFARQLLARGDHVVATARQPGKAGALNALAGEHPGRLHVLPLEVTDARARDELLRELPLAVGDARLDLLINNAGVLHAGERFGHLEAETLEHSFRTNAVAPVLLTQALAPHLADGARVVNLSSRLGAIGLTTRFGTPSYAISKAALNMATVQLAQALAPRGIVAVAVSPGWVRTDMGGEHAELTPDDAVSGLLERIDRLALADTGSFFDQRGAPIPW